MSPIKKNLFKIGKPAKNKKDKEQIRFAGFNVRVYANMFDFLILLLFLLLAFPFYFNNNPDSEYMASLQQQYQDGVIDAETRDKRQAMKAISTLPSGIIGAFALMGLYLIPFWRYKSASIGKILFGIKIITEENLEKGVLDQKKLPWMVCFTRYFGYIISFITMFAGFIAIAFNKKKRGFHDSMASCYVIYHKTSMFNLSQKNFDRIKVISGAVIFILMLIYINYKQRQ